MRILVISDLLPPRMLGGFELACLNLSQGLRDIGHEVLLLTSPTDRVPDEPQDWVDRCLNLRELFVNVGAPSPDIRAIQAHESRVSNVGNSLTVLDRIRTFQPDHVLMFNLFGLGGLGILDAVHLSGIPWTLNLGDDVPGFLLDGTSEEIRALYNAGDGGLFETGSYSVVSQTLVDEIEGKGIRLGPTTVIPRGVMFTGIERTRGHREGGTTRFVAAGILSPHKGIDLMIDAAESLKNSGLEDFRLELYGGGLIEHYRAVIAKRGLADHVFAPGRVSQRELFAIHARSDALLFPTWEREPGASAPAEAGSVGCIPIVTATCGPAERLVDGVHALKIRRTAADLESAMRKVMLGEVDLDQMAVAGKFLAEGDLSFATSVRRLSSLIAGAAHTERRSFDFDRIAVEVIRKDDEALRALYRDLEEDSRVTDQSAEPQPEAPAPAPARQSWFARLRGFPERAIRHTVRPVILDEFGHRRNEIERAEQLLRAREVDVAAREAEVETLIQGVRKDLMAVNHRMEWLETSKAATDE